MKYEASQKCFAAVKSLCLLLMFSLLLSPMGQSVLAADNDSTQFYKMISTVEYSGKGQYRNAAETLLTVTKETLPGNQIRYSLSSRDYNIGGSGSTAPGVMSFVVNPQTKQIIDSDKDLVLFEKVTSECVNSLKESPQQNIGKTWSQSFHLPLLGKSFPSELKFTLTAIQLKNKEHGDMIAVRALSEPFMVKTMKADGKTANISSRINSVYLFDPQISEVYLSASVFAASTDISGCKESLRHEIAAYKTNPQGTPVVTSDLGKDFEKLIQKVGLTSKSLEVKKKTTLPNWACFEGLRASQVASICAATACEGAANPVSTIYMPAIRTISLQSSGSIASIGAAGTVSSALTQGVPAMAGMKVAVAPVLVGHGLATAVAAGAGGSGLAIAAGNGGGGGRSQRSPSEP